MSTVDIKPEFFSWARERSGLDFSVLANKWPKYPKWESGDANPTWKQLEAFAKRTYTPLGYFFLPTPPIETLPIPDFRTLKDQKLSHPSPNLLDTIQSMQRRQNWLRDTLIEDDFEPLPFISSVTLNSSPKDIAFQMRQTLDLSNGWAGDIRKWEDTITTMRKTLASVGIILVINGVVANSTTRGLDVDEFRGFALCDEFAPLIFINGSDSKSAQMFTLAHELSHLWLGKPGLSGFPGLIPNKNIIEEFCNNVAAEFLIPEVELKAHWAKAKDLKDPFGSVSRKFKVSPIMAARRALDLNFINNNEFYSFYNSYMELELYKKAHSKPGGHFYNSQNNRVGEYFFLEVARAAKSGSLLYRDAYKLTDLRGQTFERYYNELDIGI